ncbi:MAG TPA: DUF2235 domain-containing protein [Stellaceae bacterium]
MSKNIVFCADGTWNHPSDPETDDSAHPSNVFKLFVKLEGKDDPASTRLANEQEKTLTAPDGSTVQVAKYLHGVGDSNNFLVRVLGGGFGEGMITRIVRGYTFVSRNYEPGDKIYLVGFSRGAYIARALAGLISAKGLLPPSVATGDNKDEAYRQGSAVWYAWRQEVVGDDALPRLQEFARDLPHFLVEDPSKTDLVRAPIEAVAVWDTVGSYGIPEFDEHGAVIDSFRFADTKLSDNINFGRHAVSIDEQRVNFTPTLWQPDARRIVQVLFPGGHADIGGGYLTAESGLSDCALKWMTRELKGFGVKIGPPVIPEEPNPCGTDHEEWAKPLWQLIGNRPRQIPNAPGLALSEAVLLRLSAAAGLLPAPYLPSNIASYVIEKMAAAEVEVIALNDPDG